MFGVEKEILGFQVVMQQARVMGASNAETCLACPPYDFVDREPTCPTGDHKSRKRAVRREFGYKVRPTIGYVCIPDRQDVWIGQPPQNLRLDPGATRWHA
jgi:hypothetical protein